MNKTVLVAGLGLIGGSIALSIKQAGKHRIIGYDIDSSVLEYCILNGIVEEGLEDFEKAAQMADYIILAAPVSKTVHLMQQLNTFSLDKQVIVSDVSSVKRPIMEAAQSLTSPFIRFIGGHPMAGSHKKGIEAARVHLFENAIYVLSPMYNCTDDVVEELQALLQATKSNFMILNPVEHDEMTSVISHFPHLIASSLVHQAKNWQETHPYIPKLAAGGFRDITRIASSNPEMWQDIFFHNRQGMAGLLEDWISEMSSLKELLENGDRETMYDYLEQAKEYRDGLAPKKKGAIPAFYDLYVDIRDQPGALLKVVELLASSQISINNIEILEIREGITGVLRLSFPDKKSQQDSDRILSGKGYETTIQE
ncbi:prephenate dehydrogenase [Sediminibacillus dalangtanensis]|uniref:Prephenate dehydrogenase n=1 Tax=Sediminibacillus dalangtanensis TaxID=2729421 RepID=A0ABX7VVM7_9BACI|nr:prephenate dehydrogenase [Sediminibacillus dalangtanensis]QTM99650.1 prephenate dehydrogenase [Sediminibacillus dalangtanensis]